MSAVDTALEEVNAALAALTPQLEGLDDYLRLNILEETRTEVSKLREEYSQRREKLLAAKTALEELVADGYPESQTAVISETALKDLQYNNQTIDAALTLFSSDSANNLGLNASQPEPK